MQSTELGQQLRCAGDQVVVVYASGAVVAQEKNAAAMKALLTSVPGPEDEETGKGPGSGAGANAWFSRTRSSCSNVRRSGYAAPVDGRAMGRRYPAVGSPITAFILLARSSNEGRLHLCSDAPLENPAGARQALAPLARGGKAEKR